MLMGKSALVAHPRRVGWESVVRVVIVQSLALGSSIHEPRLASTLSKRHSMPVGSVKSRLIARGAATEDPVDGVGMIMKVIVTEPA